MIATSYLAPHIGLYGLDVPTTLGGWFVLNPATAFWLGLAIYLFLGAVVLPILYASFFAKKLPGPAALRGWLWSMALWALWASVGMRLLAAYHPQITGGMMQDPGRLMLNLGPLAPLASLLAHSVYGLLLGWLCRKGPP